MRALLSLRIWRVERDGRVLSVSSSLFIFIWVGQRWQPNPRQRHHMFVRTAFSTDFSRTRRPPSSSLCNNSSGRRLSGKTFSCLWRDADNILNHCMCLYGWQHHIYIYIHIFKQLSLITSHGLSHPVGVKPALMLIAPVVPTDLSWFILHSW